MPDRDPYEAWKRRRAEIPVSEDFADRVMASLRRQEQRPSRRLVLVLRALPWSFAIRAGICSLACVAGLLRVLHVIVLFLTEQTSR
jgi:hypothetical protein